MMIKRRSVSPLTCSGRMVVTVRPHFSKRPTTDPILSLSDLEAQATATGRATLTQQILAVFSIADLESEVKRRRGEENLCSA